MLLDCTLRDGAHVNKGDFGLDNINKIIKSLIASNVDLIEVGFLEDCDFDINRTFYSNVKDWEDNFSHHSIQLKNNQKFCIMARPDRFSLKNLKSSEYIKTIRYAFYPKDIDLLKQHVEKSVELGYEVYVNPINITAYTNEEILLCLNNLKNMDIKGVAIVDTFGAFSLEEFKTKFDMFDSVLPKNMIMGIHLHENLNLSLGIIQYLEMFNNRAFIYDGSLLGMGRIPGNIPIELLMTSTSCRNKNYLPVELFEVIEKVIKPIKSLREWGYSPIYMLSAVNNIHRSYPEYFYEQCKMDFHQIGLILELMKKDNNCIEFCSEIADEYLKKL